MNKLTLAIILVPAMGFAGCVSGGINTDPVALLPDDEQLEIAFSGTASAEVSTRCEFFGETCRTGAGTSKSNGSVYQISAQNSHVLGVFIHRNSPGADSVGTNTGGSLQRNNDEFLIERATFEDSVYMPFARSGAKVGSLYDYGNHYYYPEPDDIVSHPLETNLLNAFIHYFGPEEDDALGDSDALYAGVWLQQFDAPGKTTEVVSFATAYGNPITANLDGLTGTATYGAIGGKPEASGYFLGADGVVERFYADAVLTASFGDGTALGEVTGQITNEGVSADYGQSFTLNLGGAAIVADADDATVDELSVAVDPPLGAGIGFVFKGDTVGETGGATVDANWEGKWGGKLFGGDGSAVPDFAYGTFGATAASQGSLTGAFIAPQAP